MTDSGADVKMIQYKKLWQIVSGIHYPTPKATVLQKLSSIKSELLNGVKREQNKPTSQKIDKTLLPVIDKLKQYLDVSTDKAWNILQCYLNNEYSDSLENLQNVLKTDTNTELLDRIWNYDALERMTLLKIIKNLLEHSQSLKHPYANEYKQILHEIGLAKLRQSYIEQFKELVREPAPFKTSQPELFNVRNRLVTWTERKLRETNEILQIILLIVNRENITVDELKTLVELFKQHAFGKQQPYLDLIGNSVHKDLAAKITYSEVVLFMSCIEVTTFVEPSTGKKSTNIEKLRQISTQLDKDIVLLHQNPEHGPLLLSWMIMNFHLIELFAKNPEFQRFNEYGTRATKLGVFGYLQKMISHPMYRDQSLAALIACRTIYNLLAFMCEIFDCDFVVQHKNVVELLCELLKNPNIAATFHNTIKASDGTDGTDDNSSASNNGAQLLFQTSIENFPVDFISLSMIAHSLTITNSAAATYTRKQIENLSTYAECYDPQRTALKQSEFNEKENILLHDFNAFSKKVNYVIPMGTTAIIVDKPNGTQIQFKTPLNYFDVLHHEMNELLSDAIRRPEIEPLRKNCVYWGLKYLAAALQRVTEPLAISTEMVHPIEMVFDIFQKFKDVPNPPVDLLAQCFNVCTALIPMYQGDIFQRVINMDILPFCTTQKLSFTEYAHGGGFDTGLVGYYLVSYEKLCGRYELLTAYLSFLRAFAMQSQMDCTVSLELPGLIFLLREVFPYIQTWRFDNEQERQQILAQILQHFCYVLKIPDDNEARLILRNTCVYSLLHLDSGLTVLRIVALGNSFIEEVMQNETNWITTERTSFNLLIQLSMTILMYILRLRYRLNEKPGQMSPLENIIYTQPKHIIPVVTGYMRNIFNRRLPILSCRLLRRFAIEFQMSLFACLDMVPSQIRTAFLERLDNELEYDELKIGVLEFVEACIEKQPGMTEAFFKINYDDRRTANESGAPISAETTEISKQDWGEGVLTYMEDYLSVVAKDANAIVDNSLDEISLLTQIMSLFHSLWKNNMQQLADKLLSKSDFWPSILNPLFGDLKPQIRVYSQLFNMVGLELYRIAEPKQIDENLKKTLDQFLKRNVFFHWVNNVLDIPNEMDIVTDDVPDWLCRLQSFKDLFVIILRRKDRHGVEVPKTSLQYLAEQCLNQLTERLNYTDDMRPFIILSELYLSLLFSHKHALNASVLDEETILPSINLLLNQLAISYREMHLRAKESILAIAFRSIDLFGNALSKYPNITMSFVESIIQILCVELMETEMELKAKQSTNGGGQVCSDKKTLSFNLSLNIFKVILKDFNDDANFHRIEHLLQAERVFNRILSCLYVTLPLHSARKRTTEMLDMLIAFANSRFSIQLLYCELDFYLWMKLLPPKELIHAAYTKPTSSAPAAASSNPSTWQSHEWWPIYSLGIQLVHDILHSHGHLFIKEAITFVGVHEEFLMDSLLLAKHALNETPIRLIKNTLEFVCELLPFEKQWRLEHQQSMINLMRCIQVLLDHAVSLLHRPKHLKRLINSTAPLKDVQNAADDDSFDDVVKAMNMLIQIVTVCCKCLMAFSPSLLDLLTSPEFVPAKWQPLVEIQFNAPPTLNIGSTTPQLTFGTILNAAIIFTKALSIQQFKFDEHPLNNMADMKTNVATTIPTTSNSGEPTPQITQRRRNYTSSISALSSISATATTTNEYLTNLDSDLCFIALEFVLTLLASQSLLALKDISLSQREKQLIKRELSTELSIFYDFVKKRILPETARDDPLHRRKHGCHSLGFIKEQIDELIRQQTSGQSGSTRKSISNSDRMRINVMRKLHLNQKSPGTSSPTGTSTVGGFNMTQQFSPIGAASTSGGRTDLPSSTPTINRRSTGAQQSDDDDVDNDNNDDVRLYFDPEDPTFCELSFVQLIEEDYLHFLSNLFGYICHTEKIN